MSWLRPGVQVPLATSCAFAALTLLATRALNVDVLGAGAGDAGAALTGVSSFFALRALVRTSDPVRARLRAVVWPPALGAGIGACIDLVMHQRNPTARLSFRGVRLWEMGAGEIVAVALLGAAVGMIGALAIAPQVFLVARERQRDDGAAFDHLARSLVTASWMLAALGAALAFALVRYSPCSVLLLIGTAAGLAGQLVSGRRIASTRARPGPASAYRSAPADISCPIDPVRRL